MAGDDDGFDHEFTWRNHNTGNNNYEKQGGNTMKKIILLSLLLAFGFAGYAAAASLQFDHSDADWNLADLVREGEAVTFANIETELNLAFNQDYVFYVTAYNDAGESGESNTANWTREGFAPGGDNLPQATIINIPGPVIINIQ